MRSLRRLAVLGAVIGAGWWLSSRWWRSWADPTRPARPATPWPPVPLPPRAAAVVAAPAWVSPLEGACPDGYPVKAKQRSMLYHLPGMLAYARTSPDRCYCDGDAAEADGFTRAKR